MALVYLSIALFTLVGIVSLAVDFGRWEMCKTQLQRAADAGARAGAFTLASSYNNAPTVAATVTGENYVDTGKISANSKVTGSVQMLNWTSASNYTVLSSGNYSQANAVRVTVSYTVPLTFGSVIGISSKPATRSATAMLSLKSQTVYVSANGNIWLSGEPTGTQASFTSTEWEGQNVNPQHPWQYDIAGPVGEKAADGEPYESPVQSSITLVQGALIAVSGVSGSGNIGPGDPYGNALGEVNGVVNTPSDDWNHATGYEEHGISDVTMPADAVMAVFLGSSLPDNSAAPASLDFSTAASRDYTSLSPLVKQPFYVGTGQTTSGKQQFIVVPNGATRLFVGMMDNMEWSNNSGGYNATITQYSVQMVQ
jgi:Flp pilus assembly protein TadG